MKKSMICINCPMGCMLDVDASDLNNIIVTGNTCPRGASYAKDEVTAPKRMVTGTVKVTGGNVNVVSVKTGIPIPKHLIFDSLRLLRGITLSAPVNPGDIVIKDILGCGSDFIATKKIIKSED